MADGKRCTHCCAARGERDASFFTSLGDVGSFLEFFQKLLWQRSASRLRCPVNTHREIRAKFVADGVGKVSTARLLGFSGKKIGGERDKGVRVWTLAK